MKKSKTNVIYTILLLTVSVFAALLLYLHFFAPGDEDLSGEWTANLDMSGRAAVTALDWLQDIEGVSVSLETLEPYMQDLTIQVNLIMKQTAGSGGTFQCEISPESYDACNQAAYEAFAAAFQELLVERLHMAGYTGSTDEEAVEALVTETFGMSTVSYLMTCGPKLLPSLEDLQAEYDSSGTYEVTENALTRQFVDGQPVDTRTEYYIHKDTTLVLSKEADSAASGFFSEDYPIIFTLK